MSASGWVEFWDTKHSIYVNARHATAHFRRIAEDIRAYAPANGTMLDYGCGEALAADVVAEPVARLILCEAAPNVRAMLGARFARDRPSRSCETASRRRARGPARRSDR